MQSYQVGQYAGFRAKTNWDQKVFICIWKGQKVAVGIFGLKKGVISGQLDFKWIYPNHFMLCK